MTLYTENWTPEKQKASNKKWRENHPERREGYDKDYREANQELRNTKEKKRQKQTRAEAIKLLGGKCFVCRESTTRKLVLHKKDGENHRDIPSSKLVFENPNDFVVLCHTPCHKGIHFLMEKLHKNWSWIESELGVEVTDD